jgi:hypothetical protein
VLLLEQRADQVTTTEMIFEAAASNETSSDAPYIYLKLNNFYIIEKFEYAYRLRAWLSRKSATELVHEF